MLLKFQQNPSKEGQIDPSANENYALRLALEKGHAKIAKLLLSDPRVSFPNKVVGIELFKIAIYNSNRNFFLFK